MRIQLLPSSSRGRLFLLAGTAFIFVFWVWLLTRGTSFTRPDFDRIQTGMTLNEAQGVIDPSADWALLATGPLHSQYLIVWKNSDACALVIFISGRVFRKEFYPPAPTFRDKARNWWYRHIGANPSF